MDPIDTPGCYTDLSIDAYHRDPCATPSLSSSLAQVLIERSPLHLWHAHPKLNPNWRPSEYTHVTAFGTVCHKMLLGKGREVAVVEANDLKSKAAKQAWDMAFDESMVPILEKNFERAERVVRAARAQLLGECAEIGVEGKGVAEAVWVAHDPVTGVALRCMTDWSKDNATVIYDYKTTGVSAAPHAIALQIERMNYAFQAAFYERVLTTLDPTLAGRQVFRFPIQEVKAEPFELVVCELSEGLMGVARRQVEVAIDAFARCLQRNEWPGYSKQIVHVQPLAWSQKEWIERELAAEANDGGNDWIFAGR